MSRTLAFCLVAVAAAEAQAQGAPAPAASTQAAPVQPTPTSAAQIRPVANLVVGDGVMVVKAGPGKLVYVGAGSATRTVSLTLDAAAVDEFVAESQAVVQRGTRALPAHAPDRPVLQERASARALSLSRQVHGRGRAARVSYHFFVADDRLDGFSLPATVVETKSILQALHRAARTANVIAAASDSGKRARTTARRPRR